VDPLAPYRIADHNLSAGGPNPFAGGWYALHNACDETSSLGAGRPRRHADDKVTTRLASAFLRGDDARPPPPTTCDPTHCLALMRGMNVNAVRFG
jgi:hypothetical protein